MTPPATPPPAGADGAQPKAPLPRPITGKLGLIVELLRRPHGADLSDMMEATGWQQHSVRGALAGALKRHRGLTIVSEKTTGPRLYRLIETAGVEPMTPKAKTPCNRSKAAKTASSQAHA